MAPCSLQTQFTITVTGNNPQPSTTFALANGGSQVVTLNPGTYTIDEQPPAAFFTVTFSGNCMGPPGTATASGIINAGEHQTCTITNIQEEPPPPPPPR